MLFLPIVYYGKRGLEADIFTSYMRLSGYCVQVVTTENGHIPDLVSTPASIAVISLDKPSAQVLQLAEQIRAQAEGCAKIFVLAEPGAINPHGTPIEVIERPYHLSELIKRIQSLNRAR